MRINNNLMAMNTHRMLGINNDATSKSVEKLSSGYRINRAGDDAAGLAISEKMRAQIKGLDQASRNSQDAISLVQTAEGALNETQAILQRMRELSVQSATDTNVNVDRDALQSEVNELASEITRISETTEFNTQNLLGGDFEGTFHIGANEGQNITLEISEMSAQALEVSGSGEGKATYEVAPSTTAVGTTNKALASGEQTLSVSKLDNVSVGTSTTAVNYGLSNDDGEVVAVSNDGDTYTFLTEATKVSDLGTATLSDSSLAFDDSVISGDVKLTVSTDASDVVDGMTSVTAQASVDVEGLDTGDYTVSTDVAAFNADYPNWMDDQGTPAAVDLDDLATHVLLDSDGNLAAISEDGQEFFSVDDIEDTVTDITVATGISEVIATGADAVMNVGAATANGDEFSIKADGGIDISTQEKASAAITTINDALESVSDERSKLGSVQNRLEHTIKNLDTTSENLQASESRIRDVDMAAEMMDFTKNNILQQAAQSMLAQANQQPQGVLQLLR